MNKTPVIIGGIVVAVLALGAVFYGTNAQKDDKSPETSTVSTAEDPVALGDTKDACDVYTQEIAQTIPGSGATKAELPPGAQASTDDVNVSSCIYQLDDSSLSGLTASVLVRGAKTEDGKNSNVFGFEGNQDRSNFEGDETAEYGPTEPVNGIGEKAFYDPDFEQINVLANDGQYWLIVQADSREQTEQLAKLLVENL